MKSLSRYIKLSAVAVMAILFASPLAGAASNVLVTPTNTQGWSDLQTGTAGSVNYVADATSPLPDGALQLTTGSNPANRSQEKANYAHAEDTKLVDVTELSYATKQVSSPEFVAGLASYQLYTCIYGLASDGTCAPTPEGGTTSNWTNFVFEPYVSEGNSAVQAGIWQNWNVAAGKFWTSKNISIGTKTDASDAYNLWTLAELKSAYPNAVVRAIAVNVGSYNANYDIYVDAVNFNGTIYNFELTAPDTQKPSIPQNLGWTNPTVACGGTTSSYSITATWSSSTDNVGVTGYNYQVYTPAGTTYATSPWSTNVTTNSYPGAFNMGEGTYAYQVQAVDAAGNVSAWSQPCAVTYDTTPEVLGKNECKDGGWKNVYTADNKKFKNQGQCVAYVESSDNSAHHRTEVLPGVRF